MRKKKEKDYELEQDLFAISKANRRVMIVFLVLISIPSILIFTFAQKFIVNGITSGAVKE